MPAKSAIDVVKHFMGMTVDEARQKKVCIQCKKDVSEEKIRDMLVVDTVTYQSTAHCPTCYDKLVSQ